MLPDKVMQIASWKELVKFSSEKMTKTGLFDTPRFFCDVYGFEPGQSQKAHSHGESDKVYYVLEGKAKVRVGSEEKELVAGQAALAPAGPDHGVTNPGPERLTMLVFMAPKP
jgi:mannose-6-phosphate isomerase-like protein (cupin superfamily)